MALSGMTGFARESGEAEWGTWSWEARSVNGRGLDVQSNVQAASINATRFP
ncbi:MAG: YicC/YloC family endoribonuclease, partial [Pseudomonadota bacterium]